MIFPRCLIASLSLSLLTTPGRACDTLPDGQAKAGSPCTHQSVMQERDLSFSIRPATRAAIQSDCGAKTPRHPSIALGSSVKADALIFFRPPFKGKKVSDASSH